MTGFASVKLARHLTSRQGDLSIRNKNKLLKMFEKQLTYDDLDITDKEIFIQMGYGENTPGEDNWNNMAQRLDSRRGNSK